MGNLMLMTVGSCSSPSRLRQIKALGLVPEESDRCSLPLLCFPPFILLANACHIFTARGNGRHIPRLNWHCRHGAARLPPCTCPAWLPSCSGIPLFISPLNPQGRPSGFGGAEVFLAERSGVSWCAHSRTESPRTPSSITFC